MFPITYLATADNDKRQFCFVLCLLVCFVVVVVAVIVVVCSSTTKANVFQFFFRKEITDFTVSCKMVLMSVCLAR